MTDKEKTPRDPNNTDEWSRRVMENMKRMSTDETYRQHIALLVRGDAEAWTLRQNETDNQANT